MEGTCKHEQIIARQLVHATMKLAVVDEAASFADYEEREDDPTFDQLHIEETAGACSPYMVRGGFAGFRGQAARVAVSGGPWRCTVLNGAELVKVGGTS